MLHCYQQGGHDSGFRRCFGHAPDDSGRPWARLVIVVTNCFTGVNATFLRPSIEANGLDPAHLVRDPQLGGVNIKDGGANPKAWRDIWSAGQGIGCIEQAGPAGAYIERLAEEYAQATAGLGAY